jgi:hypothetical protein
LECKYAFDNIKNVKQDVNIDDYVSADDYVSSPTEPLGGELFDFTKYFRTNVGVEYDSDQISSFSDNELQLMSNLAMN